MRTKTLTQDALLWALEGLCAIHRKPFSTTLAQQQLAAPHTPDALTRAANAYGFEARLRKCTPAKLHKESFPLIAWLNPRPPDDDTHASPALILQADSGNLLIIEPGDSVPVTISLAEFANRSLGHITRIAPKADPGADPDSEEQERQARKFGFSWFVPELLKHKKLWQEVLLACS